MELENAKAQLESIFKEHEKFLVQMEVHTKQLQLLKEMYASAQVEHEKVVEDQKRQIEELQQRVIELEMQLNAKQGSELEMMECMKVASKHMQGIEKGDTKSRAALRNDTHEQLKVMEEELHNTEKDGSLALVKLQRKTNHDKLHDAQKKLIAVEHAGDISTPKLETLLYERQVPQGSKLHGEDENEGMTKKYSRNFLLKFSKQCNEIPVGFDVTSDIAEGFVKVNISWGSYPFPGRAVGRHIVAKKKQVCKITEEEQAKQRQFKGILNELTPQNFEKLFEQIKQVNIGNAETLSGLVSQIFDKAIMEPAFCEMYANLCYHLDWELPEFSEYNEAITFKRLLLNKCQEEFERKDREHEEAIIAEVDEIKQTEEQTKEKRIKSLRRMGNIRLIGELYNKSMLTDIVVNECIIKKLLRVTHPDEEDTEALCTLISTAGEMMDHHKTNERRDYYFKMMDKLSNNSKLSSKVRSMLKNLIDLRNSRWQQRRNVGRKR